MWLREKYRKLRRGSRFLCSEVTDSGKIQCWSSFIGYDREAVLTEATKAVQDWHREGAGPERLV